MKILLWIGGIVVGLFVLMMVIGMSSRGSEQGHGLDEARAACVRNPNTTAAQCNDPAYLKLIADTKTVDDYCRNDPNPKVSICK